MIMEGEGVTDALLYIALCSLRKKENEPKKKFTAELIFRRR